MIIGIPLSKHAYTPEAYAYEKYLKEMGHQVQLDYDLDPNNDINIHFMGSRPFWKSNKGRALEIHEYQSLSTPPYAKLKNYSKKIINKKPVGRIFLNNFVHQDLSFNDSIPYIYRDMGVDEILFQTPLQSPLYDIVYCGSITGRVGLLETLLKLAKNYKIIVVGKITEEEKKILKVNNITLVGPVSRDQLPEIYENARFGLNYTPDIYPYNVQTSTKTLEYLAAGLCVISNKYQWVELFQKKHGFKIIWLENDMYDIDINYCEAYDLSSYSWNEILKGSGFLNFLESHA